MNGNRETINSDLDDKDEADKNISVDTITTKEVLFLLDKVQNFVKTAGFQTCAGK